MYPFSTMIQKIIAKAFVTQYFDMGLKLEVKSFWNRLLP